MRAQDFNFLKELVEAPSPSGYEQPAAGIVRKRVEKVADEVHTDVLGSVTAKLKGTSEGAPSIMLAGHIDEVGMIVHYINDEGYLSIKPVGGIDAAVLPGMRVDVHTADGILRGVIGRKPIHLIDEDERKTVTKLDKLFVDVGLTAEDVKERIAIGDVITYGVGMEKFGDGLVVSRALDDKMGAWIVVRVLEEVKKAGRSASDLYIVGTTMEEIGGRGAKASTFGVDPDIGIAIDVTHATDYPSIEKSTHGHFKIGSGPIIARGPNINPILFTRLIDAAKSANIDYSVQAEPRGTGTDANSMQLVRSGKITGLLSIPLRYMHTPSEVLALNDLDDAVKLLTHFVLGLTADIDFTPR
ncbi:MAG: M42 family metallopeptidase [Coriobacteriia bacterium]|nr:M42 family metallopeptidase [Coriobacteriia bacterium]